MLTLTVLMSAASQSAHAQPTPEESRLQELERRVDELTETLSRLSEDAVERRDLRAFQRLQDPKKERDRFAGKLSIQLSMSSLRQERRDELRGLFSSVAGHADSPFDRDFQLAYALGSTVDLLDANHASPRGRYTLELEWERTRLFHDGDTSWSVSAVPELTFFQLEDDLHRYALASDLARPRDRLGVRFKRGGISLRSGTMNVAVGILQFTWGTGFFVNPTNRLTPKDPLDPQREVDGVPALQWDWTALALEDVSLSFKAVGVLDEVRNDFFGDRRGDPGVSATALSALNLSFASFTLVGTYEAPNRFGDDGIAFGGMLSTNPFGLTLSLEAMLSPAPDGDRTLQPEIVASLEAFADGVGAVGTTIIVEYVHDGHAPAGNDEALSRLYTATEKGRGMEVAQTLLSPLDRRDYLALHVEPSFSEKLTLNASALVELDALGALLRIGADYRFSIFSLHAYAGFTTGASDSELGRHLVRAFGEVVLAASL